MFNRVTLIGRLTKDVELRYTTTGKAVTNFTLAVDRRFKSQSEQQEADFLPIVVWGKTAENCDRYIRKGSKVCVSGRLQIRNYKDKDGNNRYATEIVADEVVFLDNKQSKNEESDMRYEIDDLSGLSELLNDEDVPF